MLSEATSSSPPICSTRTLVMATYLMIKSSIGKVLHRRVYAQLFEVCTMYLTSIQIEESIYSQPRS